MLPIERLAWTLSGNRDPYEKWFGMFDAYFDASGHESDSPFVIVAGYVATIYQWKAFEMHWSMTLKEYGISGPFHAAEFMSYPRRGEFAKWEHGDPIAEKFLMAITLIQQLYPVLSVGCYVKMSEYNEVDKEYSIRSILPPYALAARVCMSSLTKWCDLYDIHELECIFEDGDFGRGKFIDIMRIEGHPLIPKFEDKKKFGALQAADHMAWEQNKYLKLEQTGKHIPAREPFNILLTLPKLHSWFPKEKLIEFCKAKGIPRRTE